jgi:predicted DNA-binding protein
MSRQRVDTTRVSATIPKPHEEALERLADREGVSVAHVVRRAIERMISEAEGGLFSNLNTPAPDRSKHPTIPRKHINAA